MMAKDPNNDQSQMNESDHKLKINSENTSIVSINARKARIVALLRANLDAAKQREANQRVAQYHDKQFREKLDEIINRWMPTMIDELDRFAATELSFEAERTMIETVSSDLDRHLPAPRSAAEIEKLDRIYRQFSNDNNSNRNTKLPIYYEQAIYVCGEAGYVPENATIRRLFDGIERRLTSGGAIDQLWRLNVAIHLLAPTVSDSHNSGLAVQKYIQRRIKAVRAICFTIGVEKGWLWYSKSRCAHLADVFRFPQSIDARLSYLQFEREMFRALRRLINDLRLELIVTQHVAMQHIAALKTPRIDHAANLAAKIIN